MYNPVCINFYVWCMIRFSVLCVCVYVCGYSVVSAPFVELPGHICQNSIDHEYNSLFWEFQFGCMDLCACLYARTTLLCYDDFIITVELGSISPPTVIFFFGIVWGPLHYKNIYLGSAYEFLPQSWLFLDRDFTEFTYLYYQSIFPCFYDADTFSWDSFGVLSWSKKGAGLDYPSVSLFILVFTQFLPYTIYICKRDMGLHDWETGDWICQLLDRVLSGRP